MFNTHEHILHLYECIDELRDEIHLIRMRQNIDSTSSVPSWYNPDVLNERFSSSDAPRVNTTSTGLNWSVQRENSRSELNDSYLNLPNRRSSSTRNNRMNRNVSNASANNSARAGPRVSASASANIVNRASRLNRPTASTDLTPPSNPTVTAATPNSIEFTFYEPRIANVRERLDTLLNSLRRDYNLPPIDSSSETGNTEPSSGAASGTSTNIENNLNSMLNTTMGLGLGLGSGASLNLGDDNERRLTLSEINTGCETKIHSGEDETCSICREVINETSIVREIKNCRHKFHQLCLDTWLENRRTCPICRGEVCLSVDTAIQRATEARASASNTDSVVNDLD